MSKEIPVTGMEVVRKYFDTGQEVRMGYVLSVNLETGRVTCMEANGSVVSLGDLQEDFAGVNCQVFMRQTQPEWGAMAKMFGEGDDVGMPMMAQAQQALDEIDEQEPTVTILKGDIGDFLDPDQVMGGSGYPMDTIIANEPKIPVTNPYALPGHRRLESIGAVRAHLTAFSTGDSDTHLRMEHGVRLADDTHPDEVNAQHEALHALDVLAPDKTAASDPVWGIGVSPGAAVPFNGTLWEAMNEVNRRRGNGDNVHLFQRSDHGWARTTAHHERNIDPVVNLAESWVARQGDDVRCVPDIGHFVRVSNKQELAQATYPMTCDCGLLSLLTVALREPNKGMN